MQKTGSCVIRLAGPNLTAPILWKSKCPRIDHLNYVLMWRHPAGFHVIQTAMDRNEYIEFVHHLFESHRLRQLLKPLHYDLVGVHFFTLDSPRFS